MVSPTSKRHLRHVTPGASEAASRSGMPLKAFGCDNLPAAMTPTARAAVADDGLDDDGREGVERGLGAGPPVAIPLTEALAPPGRDGGSGAGDGRPGSEGPRAAWGGRSYVYSENARSYADGSSLVQRSYGVVLPPATAVTSPATTGKDSTVDSTVESTEDSRETLPSAGPPHPQGALSAATASFQTPEEALRHEVWAPAFTPPWEAIGTPERVHPNGVVRGGLVLLMFSMGSTTVLYYHTFLRGPANDVASSI